MAIIPFTVCNSPAGLCHSLVFMESVIDGFTISSSQSHMLIDQTKMNEQRSFDEAISTAFSLIIFSFRKRHVRVYCARIMDLVFIRITTQ